MLVAHPLARRPRPGGPPRRAGRAQLLPPACRPSPSPSIRTTARPTRRAGPRSSGVYRAPSKATQAIVELHLRWAPRARVEWSEVALAETAAARAAQGAAGDGALRSARREDGDGQLPAVRAARRGGRAAEGRPGGAARDDHRHRQRPVLSRGGGADPRARRPITSASWRASTACTWSPGSSSASSHLIYNAAVLIGPDGKLIGKYRKVALPRTEIEAGITPGHGLPGVRHALRQGGHDDLLRRLLPRGRPAAQHARRGGDRLPGGRLQPAAGGGARLREPRLPRQQHLHRRAARTG